MALCLNERFTILHGGLWGRQLSPFEGLPTDIVYFIADYSSARDLVALRSVSKPLRHLLSDRGIWKKLHRRSTLLLSPGPYKWQSTSCWARILSRGEKFQSLWLSSPIFPKNFYARFMSFNCDVTFSALLGRWLLVAEGATLTCYDSFCSNIYDSAVTLHHADEGRILRVFSVGTAQEGGIFAAVVLLIGHKFIIAKVPMDQGHPTALQPVFTSLTMADGWTTLCCANYEAHGRLVIMDIRTMRRYHIPSVNDERESLDSKHKSSFFFATETHFVRIRETRRKTNYQSVLEFSPLPAADERLPNDTLYPTLRHQVPHAVWMDKFHLIHESINAKTGEISLTLCGLGGIGSTFKVKDVCLGPNEDEDDWVATRTPADILMDSFCLGWTGYDVARTVNGRVVAFSIEWGGPGDVVLTHTMLDDRIYAGTLLAMDFFTGVAFFVQRLSDRTQVEIVDFCRDSG